MSYSLNPYSAYKDSEVSWLGQVPAHWNVLRARYLFREIDRRSLTGQEVHLSMSQKLGLVPSSMVDHKTLTSESYVGGKLCDKGDLVLNRLKAHLGVFALARQPGVISPDYTVLRRTRPMEAKFFEHVLRSPACRHELRIRAKGIVEGFWRLYTDDFYDIHLPIPDIQEQFLIVRFLSHTEQTFQRYLRAKSRLISLLSEQRHSIIHWCVTRGINLSPDPQPTRSISTFSINKDWPIERLWTIAKIRSETNRPDLDLLSVFLGRGVIPYDQGSGQVHKPSLDLTNYQVVHPGDLVLNNQQAWRGSVGVSSYLGIVSPAYIVLALNDSIDSRFANYFFQSPAMITQFATSSKGVGDIQRDIHIPWLKNAKVPLPSRQTQETIVEHLDFELTCIKRQEDLLLREIELLKEYRTCLIADIVTGKLDVREAASRLHEEEPVYMDEAPALEEDDEGENTGFEDSEEAVA